MIMRASGACLAENGSGQAQCRTGVTALAARRVRRAMQTTPDENPLNEIYFYPRIIQMKMTGIYKICSNFFHFRRDFISYFLAIDS